MSNSDSFIEEVTDEIRRDRLFATFRRWGWLAILLVVLVVGGAALNEWRKARATAEARALGDAIASALSGTEEDAPAETLAALDLDGATAALTQLLAAAQSADGAEREQAVAALGEVANSGELAPRYRHLAALKLALVDPAAEPADRIAALEPLTAAGAPYRLLAMEQVALARISAGEDEAALEMLRRILDEDGVGQGLRQRASQLIVALGGEVQPA